MTLTVTRTTRGMAITTLLVLGAELSLPAAWAQAPSMPATGAPASGTPAPGAPPRSPGTPGAPPPPAAKPASPAAGPPATAPSAPAAARPGPSDAPWPRESTEDGRTYTVYQPQIEKWDGTRLHARAAFSVESAASPLEHFGVVWFSARADVDKVNRLVALADFRIDKLTFPSEPDRAADYQKVLERHLPRDAARISLDRIQAALAVTEAQVTAAAPRPVKNDPPRVIVSQTPAILVLVDGKPVLRQVDGASLLRIVNTWALIFVDQASGGRHYLRALGRWFEAATLDGPWGAAARPPAALETAMQNVTKGQRLNLLDDPGPGGKDAAAQGVLPAIYVSTVPAELVQTTGRPDYEPIDGTDLLHVRNASTNILLDTTDQRFYLLLSGRWFRSPSLTDGPWEYVPHDKVPAAFAKIPETHPRGAVLASIPGTPQAQEAVIDNSIPQTAEVNRTSATYRATYEGTPKFQPIEGTSLQYAANTPDPVIQVDPKRYYALKDGVWFTAAAPTGPWAVATTVPAAIYSIPVSSPLHYVTYVQVYGSTPQTVYVGYTPGYYGTVVAPSTVVVYGTGYVYPPVYVGSYYYPPPPTYGYGAGFGWGAVTGFAFGAATAAIWGGAWGCCGYDDIDIDRTVNINRNDAYNRWNSDQVRSNVESRAQGAQNRANEARQGAQQRATDARQGAQQRATDARQGAQQRATDARQGAQQRATDARQGVQDRAGAARSNDVYAGRDGNTYRRGTQGWEQNSGQGWDRASFGGSGESASNLNREQRARSTGSARESSYQRSGGGSYSAGGGGRSSGSYGGGGGRAGGGRGGGGGRRR
jgi:hypothetical protein